MANTNRKASARKYIFVVLAAFLLIAVIGGTYAKYSSTNSGSASLQVAKWNVKIAEKGSATNSLDLTFTKADANTKVVNGKVAPGSKLYADVVIDPTDSEVAIDYSLTFGTLTGAENLAGLTTKIVKLNGENEVEVTGNTATGTIDLKSQDAALTASEAVTYRVYVEWTDNASDTTLGEAAPTLSMTVTGTATQKI